MDAIDVGCNCARRVGLTLKTFHTLCSQPLNLGDQFGSLYMFGIDTTEEAAELPGVDVVYTYNIANNGPFTLNNVTVIDDYFGEVLGSPIASIEPCETVAMTLSAVLSEETTNAVTVTGFYEDEVVCEATDTFTITKEQPPVLPGLEECTAKIRAMLLEYTGPEILGVMVEFFPKNRKFEGSPVVYANINLLPDVVLTLSSEHSMTIDALSHGAEDLGSNVSIFINGVEEVMHTSYSIPFAAQSPAPLNNPSDTPSPNWFVIKFEQKE